MLEEGVPAQASSSSLDHSSKLQGPSPKSPVLLQILSRRKQRSAFDQVSEFDRGRIEAYRDWGLSFREIGSRVGRKQTTVMRICDLWMQEVTTDRSGQSHPPQCTT
ncbi:transposable element Tcb1 transposase [Trichonephila clavipes]|nr:transposable element Tcb1 transposase [Trichonephila clavipes]